MYALRFSPVRSLLFTLGLSLLGGCGTANADRSSAAGTEAPDSSINQSLEELDVITDSLGMEYTVLVSPELDSHSNPLFARGQSPLTLQVGYRKDSSGAFFTFASRKSGDWALVTERNMRDLTHPVAADKAGIYLVKGSQKILVGRFGSVNPMTELWAYSHPELCTGDFANVCSLKVDIKATKNLPNIDPFQEYVGDALKASVSIELKGTSSNAATFTSIIRSL